MSFLFRPRSKQSLAFFPPRLVTLPLSRVHSLSLSDSLSLFLYPPLPLKCDYLLACTSLPDGRDIEADRVQGEKDTILEEEKTDKEREKADILGEKAGESCGRGAEPAAAEQLVQ